MKRTKHQPAGARASADPSPEGVAKKRASKSRPSGKPAPDGAGESPPDALPSPSAEAPEAAVVRGNEPVVARGERTVDLVACQERIGHTFRDDAILLAALTHASGAAHRLASNERLEFLGDAILGFIVCDTLYRLFPESLEGDLTRVKSVVVSRETCGRISEQLGLTDFLIVGKGLAVQRAASNALVELRADGVGIADAGRRG